VVYRPSEKTQIFFSKSKKKIDKSRDPTACDKGVVYASRNHISLLNYHTSPFFPAGRRHLEKFINY